MNNHSTNAIVAARFSLSVALSELTLALDSVEPGVSDYELRIGLSRIALANESLHEAMDALTDALTVRV